jgi:hypothetical protein
MSTKLRNGERCPIHGKTTCCGRSDVPRHIRPVKHGIFELVRPGVWRAPDGRERCSKAELRRRKHVLLKNDPTCAACHQQFSDYSEVELAHRLGKGLNGSTHDSRMENLTLLHRGANQAQGSVPLDIYLATMWKLEHCTGILTSQEKTQ